MLIDSIDSMEAIEAVARMNATYNYSMHERENERLLRDKLHLQLNLTVIISISIIVIMAAAIVLRKMYVRRRELMQLRQVIADLESRNCHTQSSHGSVSLIQIPDIVDILDKVENSNPHFSPSDWAVIETAIKQCHPELYSSLRSVSVLTDMEWHVIMLIKLGLSTKKISEILYRSPNSISSVKSRLSKKLQGPEKSSARHLDELIRSV